MIDSKPAIRSRMRAQRLAFAAGAAPIAPPPQLIDRLIPGGTIAAYLPMAGEADPVLLIAAALAGGMRLAMPHVRSRREPMRFLAWQPGDPLATGPHGLRQPLEDRPPCEPDIILTPLLGFDRALNRLGQGAGYYDRAFAALPTVLRIGVAWSIQEIEHLPAEAWDVPLHAVITECGWIDREERA